MIGAGRGLRLDFATTLVHFDRRPAHNRGAFVFSPGRESPDMTRPSSLRRAALLARVLATAGVLASASVALAAPKEALQPPAMADDENKIAQPFAVFSGLDKITGRIISFDVAIDETVQFGALQVTPRVCYSRPQTVAPLTTSFVEVDEITLDNKIRRIFSGWMFADSPGLHAVDHAVYDVWLTDCRGHSPDLQGSKAGTGDATGAAPAEAKPAAPAKPAAAPKPKATAPVAPPPVPGVPPLR